MEAGFIALAIIIAALAMVLGMLLGISMGKAKAGPSKTQGVVHVDCSDEAEGPWLYLEATVPMSDIASQKQVTFNVNVID